MLLNITINTRNYQEIPDLIRFFKDRVEGITVQFHYPYEGFDDPLVLSPDQRIEVLDRLLNLKASGYPLPNSNACFEALKRNEWKCHDWMLMNVESDGQINRGCYIKSRGPKECALCGFAAHTEISLAFDLNLESILAGYKIFRWRIL